MAFRMGVVLELVCPDEFEVLTAPFAVRPSDSVELVEGAYRQVVEVKGDDAFEAIFPFPVRIGPSDLLAGKRQPRS